MFLPHTDRRQSPSYLALDYLKRTMYWIENAHGNWSIVKSDIPIGNIRELKLSSVLTNPTHLAVYSSTTLFLIDNNEIKRLQRLQMSYGGFIVTSIANITSKAKDVQTLTVWKDYLIWATRGNSSSVVYMSIDAPSVTMVNQLPMSVKEMVVMDRTEQSEKEDPCAKLKCQHYCVSSPAGGECVCRLDTGEISLPLQNACQTLKIMGISHSLLTIPTTQFTR
ncbi:hypothetical protein ScPMuIL_001745 [Solemya velum]